MSRPPESVAFAARNHWLVGAVALASVGVLHLMVMSSRVIAFGPSAYVVGLSLAGLYLVTGTLVWCGITPGQVLHPLCSLIYLPRPRLCMQLFRIARSPEFKEHFRGFRAAKT